MIFPKALQSGDKIGFFSPSSPATFFAPIRFERAKNYLIKQGFQLEAGSLTGKQDNYRSGSIIERAEELNALIRDPDIRCIMSTIGGSNSNALLPYIDYEALKKDPKIIIGYSDVTALLLGIYAQTGIVTFYGPALVASFGEYPPLLTRPLSHSLTCYATLHQRMNIQCPRFGRIIELIGKLKIRRSKFIKTNGNLLALA